MEDTEAPSILRPDPLLVKFHVGWFAVLAVVAWGYLASAAAVPQGLLRAAAQHTLVGFVPTMLTWLGLLAGICLVHVLYGWLYLRRVHLAVFEGQFEVHSILLSPYRYGRGVVRGLLPVTLLGNPWVARSPSHDFLYLLDSEGRWVHRIRPWGFDPGQLRAFGAHAGLDVGAEVGMRPSAFNNLHQHRYVKQVVPERRPNSSPAVFGKAGPGPTLSSAEAAEQRGIIQGLVGTAVTYGSLLVANGCALAVFSHGDAVAIAEGSVTLLLPESLLVLVAMMVYLAIGHSLSQKGSS